MTKKDQDDDDDIKSILGVIGFLFAISSLFSWALVLQVTWDWFVVTAFASMPLLTFWKAMGLRLTAMCFTGRTRASKPRAERTVAECGHEVFSSFCFATFTPAMFLGICYIIHLIGAGR